ncbi:MAG: succinate CoA transferase [Sumerlaeia bacterium]
MPSRAFPVLTAEEAAQFIENGNVVGTSGFTAAGACKVVLKAVAARAKAAHTAGDPFQIKLLTGASTGPSLDGALAEANAISFRTPYQSDGSLRRKINDGSISFYDTHLSHIPQYVEYGFLGNIDVAVVEAVSVSPEGFVYLTTSVGASPTYLKHADKVIIELNRYHDPRLREIHDIYTPAPPPNRAPLPLQHALDRIGTPYCMVDPAKIVGVVETNLPDEAGGFREPDDACKAIGQHVADFLADEMKAGRIPKSMLPVQAGVGNVANAVMATLGSDHRIPAFPMFTEVVMDSMIDLIAAGRVTGASTAALTLSPEKLQEVYANFNRFERSLVLRPQAVSNNPEAVRRLGVISMNTALEVDIYGHVNSTNVCGSRMMNGIGGSGDFTRNAYISIFMTPSIAKNGAISAIVPFASHVDHNEHSVQVVVTEHGLADLRAKPPKERARLIIDNCADPSYRPLLNEYLQSSAMGHMPHNLARAFEFHTRFLETGSMMPK